MADDVGGDDGQANDPRRRANLRIATSRYLARYRHGTTERRGLEARNTVFLVAVADVVAIVALAAGQGFSGGALLDPMLESSRFLCVTGLILILARTIALWMVWEAPRRVSQAIAFAGDDAKKPRRTARHSYDVDVDAWLRVPRNHKLYWWAISLGLIGYWVLVTISGGPFISPLAPLLLAGFFLGQIRADTKANIWFLLVGGVTAMLTSWAVSEHEVSWGFVRIGAAQHFSGELVAAVTTMVNRISFEVKDEDSATDEGDGDAQRQ
jgi:hypothetical protein